MHASALMRQTGLALLVATYSVVALAQAQTAPSSTYTPSVGQRGKDVIWVPTPQSTVDKMLDGERLLRATMSSIWVGRRPHGDHGGKARARRPGIE